MIRRDAFSFDWASNPCYDPVTMLQLTLLHYLCRVFNIKLSPPQLAAVMASFDKDHDGSVDCAEFLLKFFMTGFQVGEAESGFLCVWSWAVGNLPAGKQQCIALPYLHASIRTRHCCPRD